MITLLATVFVFAVIVLIHEWGHYITAKWTGMRVDEFAIGFGPKLWSVRKGETEYSVRVVPLGGFTAIAGMTQEDTETAQVPIERAFVSQSAPKRFLVIVAGAVMNFILAIVLMAGIFATQGVTSLSPEPVVGGVVEHSAAAHAGILPGDRIIAINGREIAVWTDISPQVEQAGGNVIHVTVERDGVQQELETIPKQTEGRILLGVTPSTTVRQVSAGDAVILGVERCYLTVVQMLQALAGMVTGTTSGADLAGPVGIAQLAGNVARTGFTNLLMFTAVLSLNLGLINLLPIPVLDGGRLVQIIWETIRGKRLPDEALYRIQMVGLIFLAAVFILATGNDLLRFLR